MLFIKLENLVVTMHVWRCGVTQRSFLIKVELEVNISSELEEFTPRFVFY